MTDQSLPGFSRLSDARDAVGHSEMLGMLRSGDIIASLWNPRARDPLEYIPPVNWWKANADNILARGRARWGDFGAEHYSAIGGETILVDWMPPMAIEKPQPVSRSELYKFLCQFADGERTEAECRSAAEQRFGRISEKGVWRPIWLSLPETQRRERGRKKSGN